MKYGVVYRFKPQHKINGSLFYCFEYFKFLRQYIDIKFYLVDIAPKDLQLIFRLFEDKYNASLDGIIPISLINLYKEKLDRTLVLDIRTFRDCKEFLTGEVHCFSNETHDMFRYKNNRTVVYYGSYPYQQFDTYCILKLNFEIFKPLEREGYGVFVSGLDMDFIHNNLEKWKNMFNRPIIMKKSYEGIGNLFDKIDAIHYVHTRQDTNNRIIPEAFFYNKKITVEEFCNVEDSIKYRYEDIQQNGLSNYSITESDVMVQACLI